MSRAHLPVVVDNDANAAALAECRFGAGVGHRLVLCVTLGTGIGGALVIDRRAGDLLLEPTRQAFARTLAGRGLRPEPPIVAAALGPDAGFIGAADMARSAARRSRRTRRRRSERLPRRLRSS